MPTIFKGSAAALGVAIAASLLMPPQASLAVPIEATHPSSAAAQATGSSSGPRRPGGLSTGSANTGTLSAGTGSDAGITPGPRRPTLSNTAPLTAER
jgi:hypothetical protein